MPILFCEKSESREANVQMEERKFSVLINKSFSRTYVVLGTDLEEQEITIAGAYGLPRVGTTSDEFNEYLETVDSSLFTHWIHMGGGTGVAYYRATQAVPSGYWVQSVSAKEVANVFNIVSGNAVYTVAWEVQVTFDSFKSDEAGGGGRVTPDQLPLEVTWDSEKETISLLKDVVNGNDVVTAANEPMGAEYTRSIAVLTLKKYYATTFVPQAVKSVYEDTVCNHVFWGFPANYALMDSISANLINREQNDGTKTYYWEVTYKIKFRNDGSTEPWKVKLLHQGTRYKDANGNIVEYVGESGGAGTGLINLAADGTLLPDNEQVNYREFNAHKVIAWHSLGIDNNNNN